VKSLGRKRREDADESLCPCFPFWTKFAADWVEVVKRIRRRKRRRSRVGKEEIGRLGFVYGSTNFGVDF
jgi:hypothetical protein